MYVAILRTPTTGPGPKAANARVLLDAGKHAPQKYSHLMLNILQQVTDDRFLSRLEHFGRASVEGSA